VAQVGKKSTPLSRKRLVQQTCILTPKNLEFLFVFVLIYAKLWIHVEDDLKCTDEWRACRQMNNAETSYLISSATITNSKCLYHRQKTQRIVSWAAQPYFVFASLELCSQYKWMVYCKSVFKGGLYFTIIRLTTWAVNLSFEIQRIRTGTSVQRNQIYGEQLAMEWICLVSKYFHAWNYRDHNKPWKSWAEGDTPRVFTSFYALHASLLLDATT